MMYCLRIHWPFALEPPVVNYLTSDLPVILKNTKPLVSYCSQLGSFTAPAYHSVKGCGFIPQ